MDFLKLFRSTSQYNDYAESQDIVKPNVSFCLDEKETHYNPSLVKVYVKYNIVNTSAQCHIVNDYSNIRKTEIDGVTVWVEDDGIANAPYDYTFSTTGEHTVAVTLSDTSVLSEEMFYTCPVVEARINYGVETISDASFRSCTSMEMVNIPETVVEIGEEAFIDCTSLKTLNISNNVETIGYQAFKGCEKIASMNIGMSVATIGQNAFWDLHSINEITVDEGNATFDSRNDCNAIIQTSSNTLVCGCGNTVISENILRIGDGAFVGRESLTSIRVPNSVTSIGENAFTACHNLDTVWIGNGLRSIGDYAFDSCYALTSFTIYATTPPTLAANAFANITNNFTIYVPSDKVTAYQTATNWSTYAAYITAIV